MHLVVFNCGSENKIDCANGWIQAYAKHPYYDHHIEQHFTDTQSAMCIDMDHVYNVTQSG